MATKLKTLLQELKCPYIIDAEISTDDDLLEEKSLRMRVLQWIFNVILPGSDKLYTLQPHIFTTTNSARIEVNDAVKTMTSIAASLGLCKQDDYLTILGENGKEKDVKFWTRLAGIAKTMKSSESRGDAYQRCTETTQRLLLTYDEDSTFPHKVELFTPVIRRELLSPPPSSSKKESRKLTKKRVRKFDDKESTEKLHQLEEKYAEIKQIVEDKENELPDNLKALLSSPDFQTRQKSMTIRMTDLTQLATAFNEKFEEKFKLYDQLTPDSQYTSGRLESVVCRANQQTQEFSKLMWDMEEIQKSRTAITKALSNNNATAS